MTSVVDETSLGGPPSWESSGALIESAAMTAMGALEDVGFGVAVAVRGGDCGEKTEREQRRCFPVGCDHGTSSGEWYD